jgi:hypothetical protein
MEFLIRVSVLLMACCHASYENKCANEQEDDSTIDQQTNASRDQYSTPSAPHNTYHRDQAGNKANAAQHTKKAAKEGLLLAQQRAENNVHEKPGDGQLPTQLGCRDAEQSPSAAGTADRLDDLGDHWTLRAVAFEWHYGDPVSSVRYTMRFYH